MNTIKFLLFFTLSIAATAMTSADERKNRHRHTHIGVSIPPSAPLNMIWYQDIVYDDSKPDVMPTSLDIYVPYPVKAQHPVVIFVHGRGMYSDDKAYYKDLAAKPLWFNHELGFIFVSINYHLLPAWQYPISSQDVANAIAWVHERIAEFSGDPEQIFLLWHSAGQTLIAHTVTDESFLKKAGKQVEIIKKEYFLILKRVP